MTVDAARRRLNHELGITNHEVKDLHEIAPYRYRFADKNGIVENEICPILVGRFDGDPKPNLNEVDDWKWVDWNEFLQDIKTNPGIYSPWSSEEAAILQQKNLEAH